MLLNNRGDPVEDVQVLRAGKAGDERVREHQTSEAGRAVIGWVGQDTQLRYQLVWEEAPGTRGPRSISLRCGWPCCDCHISGRLTLSPPQASPAPQAFPPDWRPCSVGCTPSTCSPQAIPSRLQACFMSFQDPWPNVLEKRGLTRFSSLGTRLL